MHVLYIFLVPSLRQDTVKTISISYLYTARSAEVEPPGLGSKCGKWVERFSDFGKYKGNFRNHTTSLPAYRTLSQVWGGGFSLS